MMKITVAKFGGSSLADHAQTLKACDIIHSDPCRQVIVVSAPGKRNVKDTKITDLLIHWTNTIDPQEKQAIQNIISARFQEINPENPTEISLHLKGKFDETISRGEYYMAQTIATILGTNWEFVDAASLIFFDMYGHIDQARTTHAFNLLRQKMKSNAQKKYVIPGFYGSMPDKSIKTLPRSGSDVTGAIVASCLDADLYENWTDTNGIASADPRLVNNPSTVHLLSYQELRFLTWGGATVFHFDAVKPVKDKNIPIQVMNTNNPTGQGTLIVPDTSKNLNYRKSWITGIAAKKDFSEIRISMDGMNEQVGFIQKILTIFQYHGISIEHMPTGIDDISLIVSSHQLLGKIEEIRSKIKEWEPTANVEIHQNLSLITIVGQKMKGKSGVLARITSSLENAEINIETINQSARQTTITIGVKQLLLKKAMQAIYDCCIAE
ncbi:aspartate kinase [Patescibacteria group bacterium]|nr:aspartate kinase [Patescibacteria group bacterium]